MNSLRFSILFLVGLVFSVSLSAQRALGTWRSFMPYSSAKFVVDAGDRIYCASGQSIFYLDKADGSMGVLDKSNYLSDAGIKFMNYLPEKKALVVAYTNSNIDILIDGKDMYNIPDIKNKISSSSKSINGIYFIKGEAYLSSDIGISVIDIDKKEIKNTYVIGKTGGAIRVNAICADATKIYAATDEGVKAAPINSVNLQNYALWQTFDTTEGLIPYISKYTATVNNRVFAVIRDTLFEYNGTKWTKVRFDKDWEFKGFDFSENNLYATQWLDTGGQSLGRVLKIDVSGNISVFTNKESPRPLQFITDNGTTYVADLWGGLIRYKTLGGDAEKLHPNSPPSNGVFNMAIDDNVLYMASGGTDPSYITFSNVLDGPVFYDGKWWRSLPPAIYGSISGCLDLLSVAVNKPDSKVYFASYRGGLVEYDMITQDLKKYDNSNSILQANFGNSQVSAVAVDAIGNVWMSNTGAPKELVVKKIDGTWQSFQIPFSVTSTRKMVFDKEGRLWMCQRAGNVIVYEPGENIDAPQIGVNIVSLGTGTGNGGLPNNNVWCMAEDKNGDMWVGTDEGIGVFYCAGSVLSQTNRCDADRVKVERDGFIGYLFATEIVKAIAVDGANRKWVGTTNGAWLISDDGKTELHRFTKDNSPLPSNFITDIRINQQTGEVFIGSESGLVSYMGDATLGEATKGNALVYPNPVKSGYQGVIAIKGLVDNAYVKITDVSGTLVFQGRANGGQMVWDGNGYNGVRVKTGVYMVYAATDLGKERNVAKIVLEN